MSITRNNLKSRSLGLVALLVALICPGQVKAITLDWNSVDWTPTGTLTQSFDIDSGNAGNDITITITGNTSRFDSSSPNDTTDLTGGIAGQESLFLYANQFKKASESFTITITFNYTLGVDNVDFTLFDIDRNSDGDWIDQIRSIHGTFGTTNNAATITGSANNTVAGSGTNQTITGNTDTASDSGSANALIDFGRALLTSVSFVYGNAPGTDVQSQQWIGLSDIHFRPKIPEVNPAWGGMIICGLAMGVRLRRRAKSP